MKFKLLLLLTLVCLLSCQRNDIAGVRIDKKGNIVIKGILHEVINEDDGKLIQLDKSFVDTIEAFFYNNGERNEIAEGNISEGRVLIKIPIPDSELLETADNLFKTNLIQSGNNVKLGYVYLSGIISNIFLVDNPRIDQFNSGNEFYKSTVGDDYYFIYSEGDVIVSGTDEYVSFNGIYGASLGKIIYDITLKKGWNTICNSKSFAENDIFINITENIMNKEIPSGAVWLINKYAAELINSGNEYLNRNEYDSAIERFNEAIRIDPKNSEVYYLRGIAYNEKEDWDKAKSDYTEAIELGYNSTQVYNNRGWI